MSSGRAAPMAASASAFGSASTTVWPATRVAPAPAARAALALPPRSDGCCIALPNAASGAASAEPGRATSAVAPCATAVGGKLRAAITVPVRIVVTAPGTRPPMATAGSSTSTSLAAIERLRSASTFASVGGATRHAFSEPFTLVRASARPGDAESAVVAGASSASAIGASTK